MSKFLIPVVLVLSGLLLFLAGCGSGDESAETETPVRLIQTEDLQLLSSDYQSRSLKFYDPETLAVEEKIAVDGFPLAVGTTQGKIFVGNETSRCVEVYDRAGRKLYVLGESGSIPVPNDLAIDSKNGRVFVADSNNGRIAVFSVDGSLLFSITNPALVRPEAVVLDETNELLYVSDVSGYGKILVFTLEGNYQRSISGIFGKPQGLALDDGGGHLFVADALLGQVLTLDLATDQEVGRFGSQGSYAGPHKMPMDVVFDIGTKSIYVSDFLAERIDRYDTLEVIR